MHIIIDKDCMKKIAEGVKSFFSKQGMMQNVTYDFCYTTPEEYEKSIKNNYYTEQVDFTALYGSYPLKIFSNAKDIVNICVVTYNYINILLTGFKFCDFIKEIGVSCKQINIQPRMLLYGNCDYMFSNLDIDKMVFPELAQDDQSLTLNYCLSNSRFKSFMIPTNYRGMRDFTKVEHEGFFKNCYIDNVEDLYLSTLVGMYFKSDSDNMFSDLHVGCLSAISRNSKAVQPIYDSYNIFNKGLYYLPKNFQKSDYPNLKTYVAVRSHNVIDDMRRNIEQGLLTNLSKQYNLLPIENTDSYFEEFSDIEFLDGLSLTKDTKSVDKIILSRRLFADTVNNIKQHFTGSDLLVIPYEDIAPIEENIGKYAGINLCIKLDKQRVQWEDWDKCKTPYTIQCYYFVLFDDTWIKHGAFVVTEQC